MMGYDITNYSPWEHYRDDKSNSAPVGDEHGQIYGLELEIASLDDLGAVAYLEELIDDGLLETEDSARANIQLEYEAQNNVDFEVVFNADTRDNILERVGLFNGGFRHDISCHHATSCHIHTNRYYWEQTLGLGQMDFFKAAEAVAPFIFDISGRNLSSWEDWAPARVDVQADWIKRFEYIDEVTSSSAYGGDRYELANLENNKTLELRGFSNYYKFDSDVISIYLDVVSELIPAVALKMQGREYKDDWPLVVDILQEFIDARPFILNKWPSTSVYAEYNVRGAELREQEAAFTAAFDLFDDSARKLNAAEQYARAGDIIQAAKLLLAAVELNEALNVGSINISDAREVIKNITDARALNNAAFKNAVWRS